MILCWVVQRNIKKANQETSNKMCNEALDSDLKAPFIRLLFFGKITFFQTEIAKQHTTH